MSKKNITTKLLKELCEDKIVFRVGYCDLSYLLHFQEPRYYASGVYGWNYDSYFIGDYVINTGYRGMFGESSRYGINEEYNKKAWEIVKDWSIPYEEQKEKVNALLMEYLQKLAELNTAA